MRRLPHWISPLLKIAAVLNFFLAVVLVFFSTIILASIQQEGNFENDSVLWLQLAGIGLFILGGGYLVSSFNPLRNSVALFMGIAANFFGLIFLFVHFGWGVFSNTLLLSAILAMLAWIIMLVAMLYYVSKVGQAPQTLAYSYTEPLSKTLSRFRTQKGKSLLQLSNDQPILVIFLRHFSCPFGRESLFDIKRQQNSIEGEGTRLVFVHLENEEAAQTYFEKVQLEDEHRISDPNGIMYSAFGLERNSFSQMAGWKSWIKVPAIFKGQGIRFFVGDGFRMPGVFLINRGEIIKSYRHGDASDRPDYVSLANSSEAA